MYCDSLSFCAIFTYISVKSTCCCPLNKARIHHMGLFVMNEKKFRYCATLCNEGMEEHRAKGDLLYMHKNTIFYASRPHRTQKYMEMCSE